jgi:hypothetical protein
LLDGDDSVNALRQLGVVGEIEYVVQRKNLGERKQSGVAFIRPQWPQAFSGSSRPARQFVSRRGKYMARV